MLNRQTGGRYLRRSGSTIRNRVVKQPASRSGSGWAIFPTTEQICRGQPSGFGSSPGLRDESRDAPRVLIELMAKRFAQQLLLGADANAVAN